MVPTAGRISATTIPEPVHDIAANSDAVRVTFDRHDQLERLRQFTYGSGRAVVGDVESEAAGQVMDHEPHRPRRY